MNDAEPSTHDRAAPNETPFLQWDQPIGVYNTGMSESPEPPALPPRRIQFSLRTAFLLLMGARHK
jgi:hypothetical protein